MTGAGGIPGFAPFSMGMIKREELAEFLPTSPLIDEVLAGLSPQAVVEKVLENGLGVAVTDNTKELYLTTESPEDLCRVIKEMAGSLPALKFEAVDGKVWVRSAEMGDLQSLIKELREQGCSFTVDEVRRTLSK